MIEQTSMLADSLTSRLAELAKPLRLDCCSRLQSAQSVSQSVRHAAAVSSPRIPRRHASAVISSELRLRALLDSVVGARTLVAGGRREFRSVPASLAAFPPKKFDQPLSLSRASKTETFVDRIDLTSPITSSPKFIRTIRCAGCGPAAEKGSLSPGTGAG